MPPVRAVTCWVLPGFRLRPSLSVACNLLNLPYLHVLPGFRLRPSLSAGERLEEHTLDAVVLPGFRLRPSLSVAYDNWLYAKFAGVAGVSTPAFVERTTLVMV